jgi:hypothetical protein
MTEAVLVGEITSEGVIMLLAEIEDRRTSGVLHFKAGGMTGAIELVAGQLALEQPEMSDGRDPVEVLLSLRDGSYALHQKLPPLPVSKGDEQARQGSLEVHVPADLMNYCENAGLTGKLRLEQDERSAEAIYDRGELKAIRVDGTEDTDLHEVFGWKSGHFHITAFSQAPTLDVDELEVVEVEEEDPLEREPTIQFTRRKKQDTSEIFLRSVEVALTDILTEREKRRGPQRTSPPAAVRRVRESSIPGVEKIVRIHATKKRKRQPTVRIVYASNREPAEVLGSTRHVGRGGAESMALPEASPDRVPAVEAARRKKKGPKKGPGKKPKVRRKEGAKAMEVVSEPPKKGKGGGGGDSPKPTQPAPTWTSTLETLAWVAAVFILLVGCLVLLARLPPLG